MKKMTIFVFSALMGAALYAAVNTAYPVGCALRPVFTGKPTGDAAGYRYAGYLEAIEVIYHSDISTGTVHEVIEVLLQSPEMEKYVVARP